MGTFTDKVFVLEVFSLVLGGRREPRTTWEQNLLQFCFLSRLGLTDGPGSGGRTTPETCRWTETPAGPTAPVVSWLKVVQSGRKWPRGDAAPCWLDRTHVRTFMTAALLNTVGTATLPEFQDVLTPTVMFG